MTTNGSNCTCHERTSTYKQPEPTIDFQRQNCIVNDEQEQLPILERLTRARKLLQAGHVPAPSIEALILKRIKALQQQNPNHTCHDMPTNLKEIASAVVSQPESYVVGDEEELKRLVLAREVIETLHLHLSNIDALTLERIEALERNIAFKEQDLCPPDVLMPTGQPSEALIATSAENSSYTRQYRVALSSAFITASNEAGTCMFGPLSLLFDQDKKQYKVLEHSHGRSISFAADAILWTKFSDVEGSWLELGLDKYSKTLYMAFEKHVDMLDFLTRIRWYIGVGHG